MMDILDRYREAGYYALRAYADYLDELNTRQQVKGEIPWHTELELDSMDKGMLRLLTCVLAMAVQATDEAGQRGSNYSAEDAYAASVDQPEAWYWEVLQVMRGAMKD
jgi:hypothetical protein